MNFDKETAKYLRIINKMTQEELSKKIGVTPQAVQKWEAGSSAPRPIKIIEMSELFRVPIEDLSSDIKAPDGKINALIVNGKNSGNIQGATIIGNAKNISYGKNSPENEQNIRADERKKIIALIMESKIDATIKVEIYNMLNKED